MALRCRGISPVISTIIIVAVAVAVSIAAVGWFMGFWRTLGWTEQVQVMPDSNITITGDGATLYLHVRNGGTAATVIAKVEVVGVLTATSYGYIIGTATLAAQATSSLRLDPGADAWVIIALPKAEPGTSYQVKLYTGSGSVVHAIVEASAPR